MAENEEEASGGSLEDIARAITEQTKVLTEIKTQLTGCNEAMHGWWQCCLNGGESSSLLTEVSMKFYDRTPKERWEIYQRAQNGESLDDIAASLEAE